LDDDPIEKSLKERLKAGGLDAVVEPGKVYASKLGVLA